MLLSPVFYPSGRCSLSPLPGSFFHLVWLNSGSTALALYRSALDGGERRALEALAASVKDLSQAGSMQVCHTIIENYEWEVNEISKAYRPVGLERVRSMPL